MNRTSNEIDWAISGAIQVIDNLHKLRLGYDEDPIRSDAELCAQIINTAILSDSDTDPEEFVRRVDDELAKLNWAQFLREEGYDTPVVDPLVWPPDNGQWD